MIPYEFRCPYGLVFDEQKLACEWSWLVPGCSGSEPGDGESHFGYGNQGAYVQSDYGDYGYKHHNPVSSYSYDDWDAWNNQKQYYHVYNGWNQQSHYPNYHNQYNPQVYLPANYQSNNNGNQQQSRPGVYLPPNQSSGNNNQQSKPPTYLPPKESTTDQESSTTESSIGGQEGSETPEILYGVPVGNHSGSTQASLDYEGIDFSTPEFGQRETSIAPDHQNNGISTLYPTPHGHGFDHTKPISSVTPSNHDSGSNDNADLLGNVFEDNVSGGPVISTTSHPDYLGNNGLTNVDNNYNNGKNSRFSNTCP